jgi:general secretion pathway protein L
MIREHCQKFLRWWGAELRDMLPAWARPAGPSLMLDLRGDGASAMVARRARGGWRVLGSFPDLRGAALRGLRAQSGLVLAVPSPWILRRVLRLPEAAAPRLQAVLGFEIEQHIPFAAEEVVWSARILRHLPEAQRIEVEVAVVPRRLVAGPVSALRGAGISASLVARPDPAAEWPSVALDALSPPPPLRLRRLAEAGLAAGALALSAQLGFAVLAAGEAAVIAVEARANAARAAAHRVLALEAEAQALRERHAAAAELRGGRPAAVLVLEEVARLLPDDAWLTELRLTGDMLALTGFAAGTELLLETLDASPFLGEPRFSAPVTRGPRDPAERFQLLLRVTWPPQGMLTAHR